MASVTESDVHEPPLTACKPSLSKPGDINSGTKKYHCLLPHIYPAQEGENLKALKTDAHFSSDMNDFLPLELLWSLKRQNQDAQGPPPGGTKLPQQKYHSPRDGGIGALKPPAGVWRHANRRDKLKHLVVAPPCICGAGKDISFLFDTVSSKGKTVTTKKVRP